MLATSTVLIPQAAAFPAGVAWGSTEHNYRLPVDIVSAPGGSDLVAVADVDFTAAFAETGQGVAEFDPATLRVHEINAAGATLDTEVAFQFDPSAFYNATSAATGELVIALSGSTIAATPRHFAVYFDVAGTTTTPTTVTPLVSVTQTTDEGLLVAQVTTPTTQWYYDLAGGGFSSVVDLFGNDWVSYSSATGSAGEFRGIPNLVFPEGHFHPGATSSTTTIDSDGPLRATMTSTTTDGWQMRWEVFATHARATVLTAPDNYWFLYEGTPGGALDASDVVISNDGTITNALDTFVGDLAADEWVAFADPAVGTSLYVANHTDDASVDSYQDLDGAMTVFGFGRENLNRNLSGVGRSFSVGLVGLVDHVLIAPIVQASLAPPAVTVNPAETNLAPPVFGFVSDDFDDASLAGQWTFVNPVGDATLQLAGAGTGQATASIDLPQGANHDAWTTNNSARLMQPVGNADFELEAGFLSLPNEEFQENGFLIEQDANNFIRFDVFHDGSDLRAFVGHIDDGSGSILINEVVPATTRFLRLNRTGEVWVASYSSDGLNWTEAGAFTAALFPTSAGVFAGNAGPNPAFTAVVDYIFDTASPIVPEDGVVVTTHPVDVTVVGAGSVTKSPDQPLYIDGAVIQLAAAPDAGQVFVGWSGDVTSTDPIIDITIAGADVAVTATFEPIPVSYAVDVSVVGNGTVTKSPDQAEYLDGSTVQLTAVPGPGETFTGWSGDVAASTSPTIDVVVNGAPLAITATFSTATTTYPIDVAVVGQGSVSRSPDQTSYLDGSLVQLSAAAAAGYEFVGWSGDVVSTSPAIDVTIASAGLNLTATFQPITADSGFASDDFNAANLGAQWTFIDPVGDSSFVLVGADTGQATVDISVPADTSHDAWQTNESARLMQPINNVNFELEAGFASGPMLRFQEQGLIIEQDADNWLRFDLYSDGTELLAFGGATIGGSSEVQFNTSVPADTNRVRVTRIGDTWTGSYSNDGVTWTESGSFNQTLAVTTAGVFAGNAGDDPAFTAVVDYVFDTAAPIDPEDGVISTPTYAVDVAIAGSGSVTRSPDQTTYLDGQSVELTATPVAGETFVGWTGDVVSTNPVVVVTVAGGPISVTATFTTAPAGDLGFVSDDFDNAALATQWTFVDPVGDSTFALAGAGSGQATVSLSVPAGSSHDAWKSNDSARLMQPINDEDFELEVSYLNSVAERYQLQGFIAEQDAENWVRLDTYFDGSQTRIFGAVTVNGSSNAEFSMPVPATSTYLRLNRTGDTWTGSYSSDGIVWTVAGSFDAAFVITSAGVFAGNAGANPAFTSVVDYVFDIANPVTPEDGVIVPPTYPVNVTTVGNGVTTTSPNQPVYDDGSVVQVTAVPDAGETFVGWSGDVTSTDPAIDVTISGSAVSLTATFTETGPPSGSFISDDFNTAALGSQWTSVDPVGDGTVTIAGVDTGQATVSLAVPAGTEHDAWKDNESLRLMQPIDDIDVVLEVGFLSEPTSRYQMQGLLVEQDPNNWIRLDTFHDGSRLHVFGAVTVNRQSSSQFNETAPAGTRYLRLTRTGDNWVGEYSSDGQTWTEAGSFDHALVPTSAGVFAGNAGSNPAFTAVVDYVFNAASPIDPEDGVVGQPGHPVLVTIEGAGTVAKSPDQALYLDGTTVQLTAVPGPGETFVGWNGDTSGGGGPASATLFDQVNYDPTFYFESFDAGTYNAAALGQLNDDIEAIQVAADTQVTLCVNNDGSGFCETYTSDVPVLRAELKDQVSYVVIESTSTAADPVLNVTVNGAPVLVTATFTDGAPTYPVAVSVVGSGTVAKSPSQSAYLDGTTVQVTATPNNGESFLGWTGDITSLNPSISVTLNGSAVDLTATFTSTPGLTGIDVWYGSNQTFGDDGVSQRWVNVLGKATDPQGVSSLGFQLNGGDMESLSLGPDPRRVYNAGDFNIEIDRADLTVGANSVLITMVDGAGNTTTELVTVNWAPTTVLANYNVDWSTASAVTDGAQIVDGKWAIVDGELRTIETGYDRTVAIGDLGWDDYEIEVPVTIHGLGPGSGTPQSGEPLVGFGLRWPGHNDDGNDQPAEGFLPIGGYAYYRLNGDSSRLELYGNDFSPNDRESFAMTYGVQYIFKASVDTVVGGTRYRFKAWPQDQPEPAGWTTELIEDDGLTNGSILLIAHHFDVSFGNIAVTSDSAPPSNQAPTAIAGADIDVTLPAGANLLGVVSDDGLPISPGTVSAAWTVVSGPGTVSFADATAAVTTATFSTDGTYVLRLSAFDGALSDADDVTVTVTAPAISGTFADDFNPAGYTGNDGSLLFTGPWVELNDNGIDSTGNVYIWLTDAACNLAPCVRIRAVAGNEGIERTMDLSDAAEATLSFDWFVWGGTQGANLILDDGVNEVVVTRLTTSASGGTGSGTFDIGSYVDLTSTVTIRFQADNTNGNRSYPDNIVVTVGSGTPTNQAPTANAGSNIDVTLPASANLAGAVSDDGLPASPGTVTAAWTVVSGPGTVSFNDPTAAVTTATFSTDGTYVLRLSAFDGELTDTDDITVTVSAPAAVLSLEAEAATLFGLFAVVNDGAASGGSYIQVPDDGFYYNEFNTNNRAELTFTVTEPGDYSLLGTVRGVNGTSDSFWVTVDGAPTGRYLWDTSTSTTFVDRYVRDRGATSDVVVNLDAGEHTVIVYAREDGTRLDKLELVAVTAPEPVLSLEAEDAALFGLFTVVNDGSASGGSYVHVPNNGAFYDASDTSHRAELTFTVTEPGDYSLLATVWGLSAGNSFWVTVDGTPSGRYLWDTVQPGTFADQFILDRGAASDVVVNLDVGEHTVIFYAREDGTRLDKLVLVPQ